MACVAAHQLAGAHVISHRSWQRFSMLAGVVGVGFVTGLLAFLVRLIIVCSYQSAQVASVASGG